jgi:hypothetical protein
MLAHLLPIKTGGVLSGVLFIPEIIASVLITKVVTIPLKSIFNYEYDNKSEDNEVVGKICRLMGNLSPGRLGQAEVVRDGTSLIINVKVEDDESLEKGSTALVIKKDHDKGFYTIKKFEGVR